MTELKPCKCGGTAKLKKGYSAFYDSFTYIIYCERCLNNTKKYLTENLSVENWNRRVNNG